MVLLNSDPVKNGGEFLVNTRTERGKSDPSVTALSDGGFVVTLQSDGQDGSGYGVHGQRYNALGVATGDEFLINTHTANAQRDPSVTGLSDGGFVVTWESLAQDDGGHLGVYCQRYSLPESTGGDAEGDLLRNIENLIGSDHDDRLAGDAGANCLDGCAGADTFVFASFEGDRITDFEDGEDRIGIVGGRLVICPFRMWPADRASR